MAYDGYQALRIESSGGIARATIDHPPINLLDLELILELDRFGREVEADESVRVVIVDSADPEFFAAHADVSLIQQLPTDDTERHDDLGLFHAMVERFRTMPKATIAVLEGITRGAAVSSRCPSTCASPPWVRPSSRNRRSPSASSPVAAGPSDCTTWSAAAVRSRSCSAATTSTP